MLLKILDLLGNVTGRMIQVYHDFQEEDGRAVELNLMPQLPHSVKAGIYEVYAFGDIVTGEEYRSVTTGTYINLERLFKNFRQHMNRKADAKDAEEYNALYCLAGRLTRGSGTLREWQNRHGQNEEEALYRPLDHPYHANGQWS